MSEIQIIDNGLRPNFDFRILSEIPSTPSPCHYFPENSSSIGRDGVMIWFQAKNQDPWIGIFAFGDGGVNNKDAVYLGPDEDHLAVLSRGAAYVVRVQDHSAIEVEATPVFPAVGAPSKQLLIFHDYTKLVAYGVAGLVWKSKRVSWDGIEIEALMGDGTLKGRAWDAPHERWVEFSVDIETGRHRGGSAPPC